MRAMSASEHMQNGFPALHHWGGGSAYMWDYRRTSQSHTWLIRSSAQGGSESGEQGVVKATAVPKSSLR